MFIGGGAVVIVMVRGWDWGLDWERRLDLGEERRWVGKVFEMGNLR